MSGWVTCPDCLTAHDRRDAEPRCDTCIREVEAALMELSRPWLRGEQSYEEMLAAKEQYMLRRQQQRAEVAG